MLRGLDVRRTTGVTLTAITVLAGALACSNADSGNETSTPIPASSAPGGASASTSPPSLNSSTSERPSTDTTRPGGIGGTGNVGSN